MKLGTRVIDEAYPAEVGELASLGKQFATIRYCWGTKRVPVARIAAGRKPYVRRFKPPQPKKPDALSEAEWAEVDRLAGWTREEFTAMATRNGLSLRQAYAALK